jgi:hypothetical protein
VDGLFSLEAVPTYVALAILVATCLCRFSISQKAAIRVLERGGRYRSWWYTSCLLGVFVPTGVVLLALSLLVTLTLNKVVPSGGLGLIIAVGVGVIGNNIDRQASNSWDNYWSRIHDSLRQAMPPIERPKDRKGPPPDCQRTRFNVSHERLYRRDERKLTLNRILLGAVCAKTPCSGHVLPQANSTPRFHNGLGVAALVIGVASLVAEIPFMLFPLALVGGVLGLFIGIVALSRGEAHGATNSSWVTGGLICAALVLIIGVQGSAG